MRTSSLLLSAFALAAASLAAPAMAQSKGDWTIGAGVGYVTPKSDNGALAGGTLAVDVGNDVQPTITGEYFIADNIGIEVLAATPFRHAINIDGLGQVGTTKHLPPVVSLQYHFPTAGKIKPFVGAGVNFTTFFNESTRGALEGSDLKLANSWGMAAHAGVDVKLSDKGSLRVDARWADIDTDVKLDGAKIGTVNIDPMVYGVSWIQAF